MNYKTEQRADKLKLQTVRQYVCMDCRAPLGQEGVTARKVKNGYKCRSCFKEGD